MDILDPFVVFGSGVFRQKWLHRKIQHSTPALFRNVLINNWHIWGDVWDSREGLQRPQKRGGLKETPNSTRFLVLFSGWLFCLSIWTRWFDIWIAGSKRYKYAALHNLFFLSGREVRKVQVIYSGGHLAGDILRWPKHPVTCALTQPPCKD